MRALVGALLLLALAPADGPTDEASLADRLSWNARERVAAGRRALTDGDAAAAGEAFDTAHRLQPDDPRTAYNAGTARIGTDPTRAEALLSAAAAEAGPWLAPSAWYNLGTSRLAAGDAPGAVEALTEALRRDPRHAAAKQNLELALDELERRRRDEEQRDSSSTGESEQQRQQRRADGEGDDAEPSSEPPTAAGDQPPAEGEPEPGEPSRSGSTPGADEGPLPQFRDLADMTAEQAAAILRAVEDLERQQRRERARRAAAERAAVEVDW